jgi:nucleoside-triphosphatase
VARYGVELSVLAQLVEAELGKPASEVDLFVIDEIGKMELFCPQFVEAVPRLLSGPVPAVATVAMKGGGLIAEVRARPDGRLVEVTDQNRVGLAEELEAWVRGQHGREV